MLREDVETFFCRKFATLPGVVAMYGVGTVDGVVFVKKRLSQNILRQPLTFVISMYCCLCHYCSEMNGIPFLPVLPMEFQLQCYA